MLGVGSSLAVTIMLSVSMTTIYVRAETPSRAVDHSDHASTEAREVTYEEAHDLLTAFLKVSPGAVVKSGGDMGYKEFYFFMADMGSVPGRPCARQGQKGVYVGNFQYYAVDRRTCDVWSAVFCRRIARRKLSRLQAALRRRIGLTNAQYERLKRPGPLCEPGMPRAHSGN
jgi:hypothetical protein